MSIADLDLDKLPDSEVNCTRCDVPMKDAGECRFLRHEDLILAKGDPAETFQMRACPRCGQVEMFV